MSEGYAGHLERGGIRPNVETLKSLAAALGLVYGELAVAAGYITREEYESPIDGRQLARLTEIGDPERRGVGVGAGLRAVRQGQAAVLGTRRTRDPPDEGQLLRRDRQLGAGGGSSRPARPRGRRRNSSAWRSAFPSYPARTPV